MNRPQSAYRNIQCPPSPEHFRMARATERLTVGAVAFGAGISEAMVIWLEHNWSDGHEAAMLKDFYLRRDFDFETLSGRDGRTLVTKKRVPGSHLRLAGDVAQEVVATLGEETGLEAVSRG